MISHYFLLLLILTGQALCRPKDEETLVKSRPRRKLNNHDAVNYLHQFGHLPPAQIMTAGFGTPEMQSAKQRLREAIMSFQRIADIPQTGILDEATREKMDQPRCGVPDVAALSFGRSRLKWDKTQLTYSIDSYSFDLPRDLIKKAITEAFNFWSKLSQLDFTEVSSNGDIKVRFAEGDHGDMNPFDGPDGVLAHGMYPKAGRLHFDDEENWSYRDPIKMRNDYTDLLYVAIHEVGHTLGIDHINNKDAIMYFAYDGSSLLTRSGQYKEPTAHQADIKAVQEIYGKRQGSQPLPTRRPTSDHRDHGHHDHSGRSGGVSRCPTRVDAIVADGPLTLIFEGDMVYEVTNRRVIKRAEIHDLFPQAPHRIQAAVLDYKIKKLLFFEAGGNVHAYFHSKFFDRYMKAYRKKVDHYNDLTGAISFKNGNTILLDKHHKYALYDARTGESGVFEPIDFGNFPRRVRGSTRLDQSESKLYLFTTDRVYLYNVDNEIIESESSFREWIICS